MAKRNIINIDEAKCNGCGECIPNCPEGAIQIIDKKARLISDLFCDGLGACIGHCPQDAITIEERDAQEYDEKRVMENIVKLGENVIIASGISGVASGTAGLGRSADSTGKLAAFDFSGSSSSSSSLPLVGTELGPPMLNAACS